MSQLTQPLHQRMNRRKGIMIVLTRRIGPTFPQVCIQSSRVLLGKLSELEKMQRIKFESVSLPVGKKEAESTTATGERLQGWLQGHGLLRQENSPVRYIVENVPCFQWFLKCIYPQASDLCTCIMGVQICNFSFLHLSTTLSDKVPFIILCSYCKTKITFLQV